MPIRIKPAATLQAKYSSNASNASQAYADGVANPRRDWAAATSAAAATWSSAVTQAATDGAWANAITPAAAAKQKANAATLGKTRYPQGVQNAAGAWAANTQPILDAMANVPDSPRGVKMSQQNFDRQRAFATAAHTASKAGRAGH
jgi:hypothetical protein